MKTAAVIAEYDPFHKGHAIQLKRLKEEHGFDHVVIIMSGCFMQRGTPSLLSKYERAEMALRNGADLVIELPVDFALAPAGRFAEGGVLLAKYLGAVDTIAWSCETPALFDPEQSPALLPLIRAMTKEPEEFREILRRRMAEGLPYPKAREEALLSLPKLSPFKKDLCALLQNPNNLLGLSYETTVRTKAPELNTLALLREGQAHDSSALAADLPSASAIRQAAKESIDISSFSPENCRSIIQKAAQENRFLFADDFFMLLRYRLLSVANPEDYQWVTPSLSDKLKKYAKKMRSFTDLAAGLKSRDITHSHVRRALFSVLLDLKKEDAPPAPAYARILGFLKSAEPLLHEIRKKAQVPLISKDADHIELLRKELYVSEVYRLVLEEKSGCAVKNDLQQPLVII